MTSAYNHPIDPVAHRRRLRERLELLGQPGPLLPGEPPRHYVDRRGRAFAWVPTIGRYVGID